MYSFIYLNLEIYNLEWLFDLLVLRIWLYCWVVCVGVVFWGIIWFEGGLLGNCLSSGVWLFRVWWFFCWLVLFCSGLGWMVYLVDGSVVVVVVIVGNFCWGWVDVVSLLWYFLVRCVFGGVSVECVCSVLCICGYCVLVSGYWFFVFVLSMFGLVICVSV